MPIQLTSLTRLRNLSRQFADMENTDFISDTELDTYINLGIKDLYDTIAISSAQSFLLKTFQIELEPPINCYDLPNDFHVLKGIDFSTSPFPSASISTSTSSSIDYGVMPFEVEQVQMLKPHSFADRHRGVSRNQNTISRDAKPMAYHIYIDERQEFETITISGSCGEMVCEEPVVVAEGIGTASFTPFEGPNGNTWITAGVFGVFGTFQEGMCVYASFEGPAEFLVGTLVSWDIGVELSGTITFDTGTPWVGGGDQPLEYANYAFCIRPPDTTEVIEGCVQYFHRVRFAPVKKGYALVWYFPLHPTVTMDDCSGMVALHGFEEYPAIYAAIRMLRKEESNAEGWEADLEELRKRIRTMASYRDVGHALPVADTDENPGYGE